MWYSGTSREVSILGLLGFLASSWALEDTRNRLACWAHEPGVSRFYGDRGLWKMSAIDLLVGPRSMVYFRIRLGFELGFVFGGRRAQI